MVTQLSCKLRDLRKNMQYTTTQVANKLKKNNANYSIQSIYKWEEGSATPEINVLILLAKIYHCNISFLIEEEQVIYKNLTASEIFLLRLFRNDFQFRSIAIQILKRFERKKLTMN